MVNTILNKLNKTIKEFLNLEDDINFEVPKESDHGDYSTNIAMRMSKVLRKSPKDIANEIIESINLKENYLEKVEVAGPGFINFYFDLNVLKDVIFQIIKLDSNYGNSLIGKNVSVLLEYVSANPTGYLHLGHGRGASYGDSLSRIMKKAGYNVYKEHYVNDAGNQITNLGKSIYERYKQLFGLDYCLDNDSYHGEEIIQIAKDIKDKYNDYYLNNDYFEDFSKIGVDFLLEGLKKDLKSFNCEFDNFFSEKSLYENNLVEKTLNKLTTSGKTYLHEDALWLKTTLNGDDKDRVLVKSDKTYTYLLPDIAYHTNKFERGYDYLIDVLGADHHGYVNRLRSSIEFMGYDPLKLDIDILQMVSVIKDGVEVKMSKRSGKAITLNDLIEEVGTNALRYMYVSKSLDTHMDLDLDLLLKNTTENPVYYVLYAYARISSLFRVVEESGKKFEVVSSFEKLEIKSISKLISSLVNYPLVIELAATKRLPHKITHYVTNLSKALHSYYNDEKIITDDDVLLNEKLTVLKAVSIVLKDALSLIGVNVLERM